MKKIASVLVSLLLLLGLTVPAFAVDAAGTVSVYTSYRIPAGSVRLTAHRGFSALAPENTLPAFRLAGEYGFWGAECDISPTADGEWVVMHDDTVDRMTNGTGRVADFTLEEIRALTVDAGSNAAQYPDTKVPTLTEYLDVCKEYGLHPVIEIKERTKTEDLPALAALLAAREEKAAFTVISFGRDHIARMKELLPETPAYLLVSVGETEEAISFCREHGVDGLDFVCALSDELIGAYVSSGLKTMAWTVDDIGTAERLYKLGVRDITTNSLTQNKPRGNIFRKILWAFRDRFAQFAAFFTNLLGRAC